ncbi:hypothetical protein CC77DRAFT_983873, partial [Alternaria alternata]
MSAPCAIQHGARITPTDLCSGQAALSDGQALPRWLIPADRRGWRRIVQNFTPAWVCS